MLSQNKYAPLIKTINSVLKKSDGTVIIAIDGNCAAGKSTLAEKLHERYGGNLFHMDDFFLRPKQRTQARYTEPGGNVDRERFLTEVLQPLAKGLSVNYRAFNCKTMDFEPARLITPKDLNIVEGAYSTHPDLINYYDLKIFLKVDEQEQKKRIFKRNGKEAAELFFEKWIPMENRAFETFKSENICDIIIL